MMSLNNKLKLIRDALNGTSARGSVFHYKKPNQAAGSSLWIVWQEDGSSTNFWANNRHSEQQLHGTIDLYTKQEYDPLIEEIQDALNNIEAGWSLLSVQYEDETNLIHYEWEWNT